MTSPAIRPEIQGLRAAAVALVLVFHLWPGALPGGYVGVDVFFAISGFLITSHLLREAERTGRVRLAAFWARRARRLLPASLLVLACCAAATAALVPISLRDQYLGEIRASALYVQNWHLADAAVDYLAAEDPPSPVRHFWSLSAEEQFYAVWPLLVALAAALTGRAASPRRRRRAVAFLLGGVTLAGFGWAVQATASDPAAAYFVTPARAWEFGAGALLAALAPVSGRGTAVRAALGWAGGAAILSAAFLYGPSTPFPGTAALLPVLGALAVIHAGVPEARWALSRALALAPVQRAGDWSYAIYLWHWPLIVLTPFALARPLDDATRVAILGATVVLAALTKVLVEDPIRRGRLLVARPPRWTFAAATAAAAAVLLVSSKGTEQVQAEIRRAQEVTVAMEAAPPRCFGAAARAPRRTCRNPTLRTMVVPTPVEVRGRWNSRCRRIERLACSFGVPPAQAREHVALLGDSHAAHWRAALAVVARRRGWAGLSVTRTSCAFSAVPLDLPEPKRSRCASWNRAVPGWFARHPEVTTVFVSQLSRGDAFGSRRAGYAAAWRRLPRSVERIVVLRDPPASSWGTAACIERAMARRADAGRRCAQPRRTHLLPDPAAAAARSDRARRTTVVDLTPVFCGPRTCLPVIGGVLVHKDAHHLTRTFARTLGPLLDVALERMLPGDDRRRTRSLQPSRQQPSDRKDL